MERPDVLQNVIIRWQHVKADGRLSQLEYAYPGFLMAFIHVMAVGI
jgi:hypothetical protein